MRLKKHSLTLGGHRTSISLEDIFWQQLAIIAKQQNKSVQELIEAIDKRREGNLSSAIRVYIVEALLK